LEPDVAAKLVVSLVFSRLDYCNAMLAGLPRSTIAPLQRVQNAAARLVARLGLYDHVTATLKDRHWLPIEQRIVFKLCVLMHQVHIHVGLARYRAFSLPGQFAPRSESANRTLADSLPGQLAHWPFRSVAISLPGTFAPWPFRSGWSKSLFIVKKIIQRNQSNLKHAVERAT